MFKEDLPSCPIGAEGAARQRQAVIHQQGVLSYLLKLLTLLADTLASREFSMSSPLSPPPHIASLKSTFFNCEKNYFLISEDLQSNVGT